MKHPLNIGNGKHRLTVYAKDSIRHFQSSRFSFAASLNNLYRGALIRVALKSDTIRHRIGPENVLRDGLALVPVMAHLAFGHACIVTRQFDRAIAAYQRAVELNPSSAVAYHGLGLGLMVTDRLDEAVGMVEQAMRLSPHDPSMHNFLLSLALAHFAAERYEEAVACVRRSLQLKSDRPAAYRILASSYGHMGRTEEAKIALDAMSRLPHWSEEKLRAFFTSDATVNRIVEGLHKAGWKEDEQG